MEPNDTTFLPIGHDHAIDVMLVVLEFNQEFKPEDFAACIKLHESSSELRNVFPRKMVGLQRKAEPSQSDKSLEEFADNEDISGLLFADGAGLKGGVSVRMHSRQLRLVCYKYPSWSAIRDKYWSIFSQIAKILSSRGVEFYGLQVVDEFRSNQESIYFDKFSEVLRIDSDRVPKYFFQGFGPRKFSLDWLTEFDFLDLSSVILHRLKVDILPIKESKGTCLKVSHMQRVPITKEATKNTEWNPAFEVFDKLFQENKSLVRGLLHEDLCKGIGLS